MSSAPSNSSPRLETIRDAINMPRAWRQHEAEIRHMYLTEGKTLKEVREAFITRYGFEASTRAYRLKFKEWGLQKNSVKKENRRSESVSWEFTATYQDNPSVDSPAEMPPNQRTPLSELDSGAYSYFKEHGVIIPMGTLTADQIHEVIKLSAAKGCTDRGLEILLLKWVAGGEGMKTTMALLNHPRIRGHFNIGTTTFDGINIFTFMSTRLCLEEYRTLTKLLLRLDLDNMIGRHSITGSSPWEVAWRQAVAVTTSMNDLDPWAHAQGFLNSLELGSDFEGCAIVVIAERMLQNIKARLEEYHNRNKPLNSNSARNEARHRQWYMMILKDLCDADLDVDLSWYKYALKVSDWNESSINRLLCESDARLTQAQERITFLEASIIPR